MQTENCPLALLVYEEVRATTQAQIFRVWALNEKPRYPPYEPVPVGICKLVFTVLASFPRSNCTFVAVYLSTMEKCR